jgi:hypothetical protein
MEVIHRSYNARYLISLYVHVLGKQKNIQNVDKTYNSGDSPVVTHLTTNPPFTGLSTAERTGSAMILKLWSYVKKMAVRVVHILLLLNSETLEWHRRDGE